MPLVSASNEIQAKEIALRFLGFLLKIAGHRPAIFQIRFSKKLTYLKYALGQCLI